MGLLHHLVIATSTPYGDNKAQIFFMDAISGFWAQKNRLRAGYGEG
jgi:hypothetical protein